MIAGDRQGEKVALDYLIDSVRTDQARVLFAVFRGEVPDSELHAFYVEVPGESPRGE